VIDRLSKALRAADMGDAHLGVSHASAGPDGIPLLHTVCVSILVRGDLDAAIARIRETLGPMPARTVLRVDAPTPRELPI
jgi:hypothetical protein